MTQPAELVSVVVPVYNSVESLPELTDRFAAVFAELGVAWELIFVDDHSPNAGTWPALEALAERPEVVAVRLSRNFGKPGAVLAGFHQVRGTRVVTVDDDLQHRPEDLPALWAQRDHDVVIGGFPARKHGLFKRAVSGIKGRFDKLISGKPPHITITPYKLYQRHVVDSILASSKTPYPFIGAAMLFATRDLVMVDVGHEERKYGRSGFTVAKMVKSFLNLLINHSSFLLQVVAVVGVAFSALSVLLAGYYLYRYFFVGIGVQGWTTLVLVMLFTNGLLLFSMGVVGEYLVRAINASEQKPAFLVRTVLGRDGGG